MPWLGSLAIGLALSALIGGFAYWRGALSRGGVLGAMLTGTAIFGLGGFVPGLLLVAFFVSSTLLSHYKTRVKEKFSEKFQKGSRRDLGQALANGGWAALLAVSMGAAQWFGWDARVHALLFAAFLGALATVTADTWATEIGVLSKTLPRLVTTGRVVPAGTSGGITPLGTATAFGGGIFMGIVAAAGLFAQALALGNLGWEGGWNFITQATAMSVGGILLLAGVCGLGGSLFDSLLGATAQGVYFCEYDETQTEKKIHGCGRATRLVRGWAWLDNDLVNFSASVFGSALAVGAAILFL
ncbi:DUF92 domain-containing protein [Anaerolineae bacterium CFX7]|nr:DUF92 domain-containing protein [Anaerolineae bacterium CFX7]